MKHIATTLLILSLVSVSMAGMLDDAGIETHGFIDVRAGTRLQDDPYQRDTSLAEARLQLQIERLGDLISIHTRFDLLHDDIPNTI